jgi:hypothetical protein
MRLVDPRVSRTRYEVIWLMDVAAERQIAEVTLEVRFENVVERVK